MLQLYFFYFSTEEKNNIEVMNRLIEHKLILNTTMVDALKGGSIVQKYNVLSAPSLIVDFGSDSPIPYSFHSFSKLSFEKINSLLGLISHYNDLLISYNNYPQERREEVDRCYRLGLIDPFIDTEETYRIIYNQKELANYMTKIWCCQ
jgi:hypothetical protein